MHQPEKPAQPGVCVSPDPERTIAPNVALAWVWWAALILVLALTTAIRIRLLDAPLERDEGEYAYGGQLLLHGVSPYQGFYTMKWPGTHAAYAVIMALFGETHVAIHAGLILVNLANAALIFLLARRAGGQVAGVVAAGTYALLSINPVMVGLAAHATHFVTLPALGGLLLVQRIEERTSRWQIFLSGLLFGLAALMKQSGAAFGLFAVLWLTWQEWFRLPVNPRRLVLRLGLLTLGGALPLLVTGAMIAVAGAFDRFWFWTVQYARAYASLRTPGDGFSDLREIIGVLFQSALAPWTFAGLGVFLLLYERSLRSLRPFVIGLAFFSCLAVCPGWYFRGHYFLMVLPVAGLLAGVAAHVSYGRLARLCSPGLTTTLLLLAFFGMTALTVYQSRRILFQVAPRQIWRSSYTPALFAESIEVGEYLRSHCPANARIAVLGSEPQIYFYSRRRSATGHIYMYPLMESQPYALLMQQQLISEIESSKPDYVVWVHDIFSWMRHEDSPGLVFEWFQAYIAEHLELVAWVEVISKDHTEYHWSAANQPFAAQSECWLAILKNKDKAISDSAQTLPSNP